MAGKNFLLIQKSNLNVNCCNESNIHKLYYIPKRVIVALLTSIGLLILTVIQTNFAITNSLILNPDNSLDIPVDDDHLPNRV
jgi:hypothetical protein